MKVFLGAEENFMHIIVLKVSKRNVAQHPLREKPPLVVTQSSKQMSMCKTLQVQVRWAKGQGKITWKEELFTKY
jgi:hypothetical protein